MTTSELEKLVTALYDSNMVHAGVVAAHRVVIDSLISAIGLSLPPLLGTIADNLDGLQQVARDRLEPDSVMAFDNTVTAVQEGLRILKQ